MPTLATRTTSLCSLAALKAWLAQGGLSSALDDARLVPACDAASEELERQTGCVFVTRTVTETRNGDNRSVLKLRARPPVAVTSLTIGGSVVPASSYSLDPDLGLLWLTTGAFPAGFGNVVVVYTAGYGAQDAATLPADVVRACLDLSKAIYDELTTGAIAATSVTAGNQTFVLKAGPWPPSVERVIQSWKDVRA